MIAVIYGTRPEAIKLASAVEALRSRNANVRVICTGQHRDLLAGLMQADVNLELMHVDQTPSEFLAKALPAIDGCIRNADHVLVQGDTVSAFAGALTAFHRQIYIGHIEAGLRTYNLKAPFPEEGYRQMIDRISTRLYAPTTHAASNLMLEGFTHNVIVTGNTGIDAALKTAQSKTGQCLGEPPFVLATVHRREAIGPSLEAVCRALARIAHEGLSVVLPVHPNPEVRKTVYMILGHIPNIKLIEPLAYPDLIRTMLEAVCVITDSGGIQEEAPTLGVPVLVTRETTERPEAVEAGTAILVGFQEDRIVTETLRLYRDAEARSAMAIPRFIYGDGRAGERIVEDILS